ncbi:DUF3426 domain-containing protein [Faunimonas pinastri]
MPTMQSLVTYSDRGPDPWERKVAADRDPEPPRRGASVVAPLAGCLALAFIAAFVGFRGHVVRAVPSLAGLYAAAGMPVNLDGLDLRDVTSERSPGSGTDSGGLSLKASIVNPTRQSRDVPIMEIAVRDGAGKILGRTLAKPPVEKLGPGQSMPVVFRLAGAPDKASSVLVRFAEGAGGVGQLGLKGGAEP